MFIYIMSSKLNCLIIDVNNKKLTLRGLARPFGQLLLMLKTSAYTLLLQSNDQN